MIRCRRLHYQPSRSGLLAFYWHEVVYLLLCGTDCTRDRHRTIPPPVMRSTNAIDFLRKYSVKRVNTYSVAA